MIHVTFPDGARRAFEPGLSGVEIAKSISPSLAKRSVAMVRDGTLADLADKVEADATVSGNVIEGAPWVGILVGWGASLRDVAVQGNVVRDAPIGIGVSIAQGAGSAVIADNVISGASQGAVLGMNFDKPVTADLARGGSAPPQLRISGNQAT